MNDEKVRAVIVELFTESGVLGHYRQQYSVEKIEEFVDDRSLALAKVIVSKISEKFEEYVAISVGDDATQDATKRGPVAVALSLVPKQEAVAEAVIDMAQPSDSLSSRLGAPVSAEAELAKTEEASASKAATLSVSPAASQSLPQNNSPPIQNQTDVGPGNLMPRKFSFRLKGGKLQAGIPYDGKIESVDGAQRAIAHILSVQFPPEIGLQSDASDPSHIIGTPTISGDVSIGLTYRVEAPGVDEKALTSSIAVFINHDPKTLWKDLPSDEKDPYWKPDVDSTIDRVDGRMMIAASKRGRSHAHEGKFRDDDFHIAHSEKSGWTIIAVADGAGSAAKSRHGSKIAVCRATDVLLDRLAGEDGERLEALITSWYQGGATRETVVSSGLYPVLGIAAFEACKAIEAEASAAGVAAKEFSTTLLITAYKQSAIGHIFATYWVGDGGVGIYLNDGTPKLLGKVDSGEFAGQTRFLDHKVMTTEEIAERLQFAVVDDFKALIAMTDGITDPYFMTDNNLESGEYWGALWSEINPALTAENPEAALLSWLDFWSPGNHDDRTIAVLW